jgi:hypothetical protein
MGALPDCIRERVPGRLEAGEQVHFSGAVVWGAGRMAATRAKTSLIENRGVNKETYASAFETLTGRPAEHRARAGGRTEPEIMRDMLLQHGIEPTADHLARMTAVLEAATLSNARELSKRGHELPGARDALAAFQRTADSGHRADRAQREHQAERRHEAVGVRPGQVHGLRGRRVRLG